MGTVKFGGRRSWGTEVQPKIKDLLWRVLRGFFLLGKGLKVEGLILICTLVKIGLHLITHVKLMQSWHGKHETWTWRDCLVLPYDSLYSK